MATMSMEDGVRSILADVSMWISLHTFYIMCIMAVICVVIFIVCYVMGEKIVRKTEDEIDDEMQEQLDEKYDFWQTIGIIASNSMYYLSMMVFAFTFQLNSKAGALNLLYTIVPFAVCIISAAVYQIAVVKQVKRKDPSKDGDAADMNFEKVWMKSCDEGEKESFIRQVI